MPAWNEPPINLTLGGDEVAVWRVPLDSSEADSTHLYELLSADEQQRAARFHLERDRKHFAAARGHLRRLLGLYLARPPAEVRFAYAERGKPYLAGCDLSFNLSHSHGLLLLAFARGRALGIDVERIRPDFATEAIAEHFFARAEAEALRALPGAERAEAFFNCWTRKEAYIKARGDGLAVPLDQFSVTLAPGEPARLLDVCGDPAEAARWELRALTPAPGYAAALAVEGHGWRLACYDLTLARPCDILGASDGEQEE